MGSHAVRSCAAVPREGPACLCTCRQRLKSSIYGQRGGGARVSCDCRRDDEHAHFVRDEIRICRQIRGIQRVKTISPSSPWVTSKSRLEGDHVLRHHTTVAGQVESTVPKALWQRASLEQRHRARPQASPSAEKSVGHCRLPARLPWRRHWRAPQRCWPGGDGTITALSTDPHFLSHAYPHQHPLNFIKWWWRAGLGRA